MKDGDMAKIELSKLKNDLSSLLGGLAKDGKPVSPHAVIAAYRKKYPKGLSEEAKTSLENMGMLRILGQLGNRTPLPNIGDLDLFGDRKGLHNWITVAVAIDGRKELHIIPTLEATIDQLDKWLDWKPKKHKTRRMREPDMVSLYRDVAKVAPPETLVSEALKLLEKAKQKEPLASKKKGRDKSGSSPADE